MSGGRLTQLTVRGLAWSGSALTAQVVLNIVSVSVLARILTPHDYGVVAGALIVVAFGTTLSRLGLGPALIQRRELKAEHIATAVTASFVIAILFGCGLWLSAPLVARAMHIAELEKVSRAFSFVLVIQSFNMLTEAVLSRQMQFRTVSLVKLGSWFAATFFVAIPLAYSGWAYWSLVIANIAQAILAALAFAPFSRPLLVKLGFSRWAFRDLLSVSLGFSLSHFLTYIASYADNAVVGRMIGPASLGIYSRSFYLISMPSNLFDGLTRTVVFPVMSQVQDDQSKLRGALLKGLALTAFVTIPGSAFLATFATELVTIILGSQWNAAIGPFIVFSLAVYFRVAYKACSFVLMAKGRSFTLSAVQGLYAVLVIVGALVAAPHGLVAVCVAASLAIAITYACYAILAARLAGVTAREFASVHVRPFVVAIGLAVVGGGVKILMNGSPAHLVLPAGAMAIAIPILLILYAWPSVLLGHYGKEVLDTVLGNAWRIRTAER